VLAFDSFPDGKSPRETEKPPVSAWLTTAAF
jgi:hypothetical protein